jgi:hypothetical protein
MFRPFGWLSGCIARPACTHTLIRKHFNTQQKKVKEEREE